MESSQTGTQKISAISITQLFDGQRLDVYGTNDQPYFIANQIGSILGIKKVRNVVTRYDEDEFRVAHNVGGLGIDPKTLLLTPFGLYRLLYTSRSEISKKFRRFVGELLEGLRQGKLKVYEDRISQLEQTNYEITSELLKVTKTGMVYRVFSESDQRYYIGSTIQPLTKRFSQQKSVIRSGKGSGSFTLWGMDVGLRNIRVELLETIQFTDKRQLLEAKQRHISLTPKILLLNDQAAICRTEDPPIIQTSSAQ